MNHHEPRITTELGERLRVESAKRRVGPVAPSLGEAVRGETLFDELRRVVEIGHELIRFPVVHPRLLARVLQVINIEPELPEPEEVLQIHPGLAANVGAADRTGDDEDVTSHRSLLLEASDRAR
jgi:hypothetical protein